MARKLNTINPVKRAEHYLLSWEDYVAIKPFSHNPESRIAVFTEYNWPEKTLKDKDAEAMVQYVLAGKEFPISEMVVKKPKDMPEYNMMISGHRRQAARIEAVNRGAVISTVEMIVLADTKGEPVKNEADYLAHTMAGNSKDWSVVEKAEAVGKFLAWGWTPGEIAIALGVTRQTIESLLVLDSGGKPMKQAVEDKALPQGQAIKAIKESQGDLEQQEKVAEKAQEEKKKGDRTETGRKPRRTKTHNEKRMMAYIQSFNYDIPKDEDYPLVVFLPESACSTKLEDATSHDVDWEVWGSEPYVWFSIKEGF